MPLISWAEYESMLNGVADGTWRVIGWGAGTGFSNFHNTVPLRHDYLVDSDPAKWGTYKHCFEIRSPQSIAYEDPSKTIVIIYNFFDHGRSILSALDKIGPYKAIFNFHPPVMHTFIQRLTAGLNSEQKYKHPAESDCAILVQGPLISGISELVVRYYANRYPKDWLIVSTWQDSPPELLSQIQPYCDSLICNPLPLAPGIGNRNFQIVSTKAGLEEAARIGVAKVMKTRTDTLATADNLLQRASSLQQTFNNNVCHNLGLSNRIVAIERYTMRYIPYRVSDILLFGDLQDMMLYWDIPLDERNDDFSGWTDMTFQQSSKMQQSTEVYITSSFLKNLNWPLTYSLEDYWNVLRNFFVVVDERWFGHFFPRYDLMTLDDARGRFHGNSYVDFNFWHELYSGLLTSYDARNIKIECIKMKDSFNSNPILVNSPIYSDNH